MKKEMYVLDNENAKACYEFTLKMQTESKRVLAETNTERLLPFTKHVIEEKQEALDLFTEELNGFSDYMGVMIDLGLEHITIPEQYRRIYISLLETKIKSSLFLDE